MSTIRFQPPNGQNGSQAAKSGKAFARADDHRPGYLDQPSARRSLIALVGAATSGALIWAILLSAVGIL